MHRVLVLGCSGSGKSTFARDLAHAIGLPVIHLDQHYWRPGWIESRRADWHTAVANLVMKPEWIMDGYYGSTLAMRLARADTVFFLDMPRWLDLSRVVHRTLRDYGRSRADMPGGCPERFDWLFLKYIWNFNRNHRPKILAALSDYDGTVITFRQRNEVAAFLAGVTLPPPTR